MDPSPPASSRRRLQPATSHNNSSSEGEATFMTPAASDRNQPSVSSHALYDDDDDNNNNSSNNNNSDNDSDKNDDEDSVQPPITRAALRRRSSNAALVRRSLSSSSASAAAALLSQEPWAGWSTVVKVLYAIIVPAIIIYLLARIEPRARTTLSSSEYHHHHPFKEQSQRPMSPWEKMDMQQRGSLSKKESINSFPVPPMAAIQQTSFDGFMLFGDSITQYSFNVDIRGFGAQVGYQYQRRLDMINRGFSGYTTEEAIHLLPQFLPQGQTAESKQPKIQFLTIFFGANDACIPGSVQHVPLERYERNLRALIDMVHSPTSPYYAPWTKIIVICPPVIDYERWRQHREEQGRPMDRTVERSQQTAAKCAEVAREYQAKNGEGLAARLHQVDVIDTWNLMNDQIIAGNKTLQDYLSDGVHLNPDGNELIYQELMKLIRTKYSEWDPEVMPMHAPWWGNLDRDHRETDLLIGINKRS
ncbi:hypothetical protein DFQ27_004178 [Actinomortierella ambigua]|uniref:SGNH hydrolase-type esterase domain-containing protein n=1 Tax=Actinomortierella ambigua TaxID=1343610 RepID=A0A9P6Q6R9_9FUNG|nr:hypothetical protein DFQ27_004178 [Actinomortierella ambigua]